MRHVDLTQVRDKEILNGYLNSQTRLAMWEKSILHNSERTNLDQQRDHLNGQYSETSENRKFGK